MRGFVSLISTPLLVGGICFAQPAGVKTTEAKLPNGDAQYTVTNVSGQPITALLATFSEYDGGGHFLGRRDYWQDTSIDGPLAHPPKPGESRSFRATSHSRARRSDFRVWAVILEDGSAEGEPDWVERLVARRKAAHRYLTETLEHLNRAESVSMPETELLEELNQLKKRLKQQVDLDDVLPNGELRAIGDVFGMVNADLMLESYDGETWRKRIRRVEQRCRNMKRSIEMAQPTKNAMSR